MTAVEGPRPLQTIFPSAKTAKTQSGGRRTNAYRKIRWKTFDPSKKSTTSTPDLFVQWQPPDSSPDAEQEDKADRQASKKKSNEGQEAALPGAIAHLLSPLERLPCNGTRVNPFLALPIKTTETVQDTMDYFITICKNSNNDKSLFSGSVNPHLTLLLPYALKHAMLFESIISVCRASILISLGRPIWEDYAFVQHRGSTIARLNEKLKTKQATDDAALLTVTMLMTLEYLCGDQQGVLMHCKGLERMLQLRGPLVDEDGSAADPEWLKFVKLGLTAYKALGSFVTGQPPEIPRDSIGYLSETFQELQLDQPLAYPDTPFSSDICIILSRLPSGLSELCLTSQVSVQMIKLLASISAAATLLVAEPVKYNNLPVDTFTPSSSSSSSSPSSSSLFTSSEDSFQPPDFDMERKHIMLQTILSSLQRMSLTTTLPIEYHLTSGLLSFLFQLRDLGPVNLFYDPILRKFITTLPNQSRPSSPQEQNCMIWTSMAVAGTLALRTVPMPDSHQVMDHALDLYPQMRTWSRLERILRTYFTTDDILAHWQRVWRSAMNRREFLLRQRKSTQVSYGEPDDTDIDTDSNSNSYPPANMDSLRQHQTQQDLHLQSKSTDQILRAFSLSSSSDATPIDLTSESIRSHIQQHIAGAPRSVFELSQAMGLCPLRSQITGMGAGTGAGTSANVGSRSRSGTAGQCPVKVKTKSANTVNTAATTPMSL